MSQLERQATREQARAFNHAVQLRPPLTRQEKWHRVKNFAEGAGIGWMIRKLLS